MCNAGVKTVVQCDCDSSIEAKLELGTYQAAAAAEMLFKII
jgi:hypothetical protein